MSLASSPLDHPGAPVFADGLGERVLAADSATGELLQILRLRSALTAVPSFEFALRERTARLMNFRHAYYARVRRIDRSPGAGLLAVVSDHVEGTRLSDILAVAQERGLQLDTNAALALIRQLVPAVALLHENARDASHGLVAPERLVVTPHGRIVIVEHVAGSAIEQLQYSRERLWQEFRIAMPASAGVARFDHRADVNGIGITALALVLGRPIGADEFPHGIPALLLQARERSPMGDERPLSNGLRSWLGRSLQLDVRRAFASAPEALAALEETLATDPNYVPAPVSLETFLSQYNSAILEPPSVPAAGLRTVPPAVPAAAPPQAPAAPANPAPSAAAPERQPAPMVPPAPPAAAPRTPGTAAAAAPSGSLDSVPSLTDLIAVADLAPAGPVRQEPRTAPPPVAEVHAPETDADASHHAQEPSAAAPGGRGGSRRMLFVAAAVVIVAAAAGVVSMRSPASTPVPALGTLVVQSSPAGVEVFVDGVSRGMTPSRISLSAGSHILELRGRGVPRVIPLQVPAGGEVSQYLEFADTPSTGMLVVHSQPAGATVIVDGVARGKAPLTLEGLEPGDHDVVLQLEEASSRHTVKVLAGTTASLVAPVNAAAEGPVSGWISVRAPVTLEIREDGQLLGTTDSDRLMMAAGRHTIELVNATLSYRETRTVQVAPGKVAALTIDLPRGVVNLNATPWAEVWIDGRRVGDTPIGNLQVPIGPHEVLFRHPELGDKRHAISVTTAEPVRLSVSMR